MLAHGASLEYVQQVFGMVEADDKTSAYIFDKVSNNVNAFSKRYTIILRGFGA